MRVRRASMVVGAFTSDASRCRRNHGRVTPTERRAFIYAWGNNPRRARLKGGRCVVLARGAMGSVLVCFLDTGEKVITSRRALRAPSQGSAP
jgi:hypothetical protein